MDTRPTTHVITISSGKGGCGKSTATINTAVDLLGRGRSTVIIDTDKIQLSATKWGALPVGEGITRPPVLSMAAADFPRRLSAITEEYCVVDTKGDLNNDLLGIIAASDLVLLPSQPSAQDIWAAEDLLKAIEANRSKMCTNLKVLLILTCVNERTLIADDARRSGKALAAKYGARFLSKTYTTHRVVYREAFAAGEGVTTYAPSSAAAEEVTRLTDRVIRHAEEVE